MPRILLLLTIVWTLGSCGARQTDPVTGDTYRSNVANDFATQDRWIRENRITELRVAQDGGMLNEPQINTACQAVFDEIVAAIPADHRRDFRYSFYLSTSPEINAYTYGGGRVHCFLGALAACDDESEFAGLLAHELGHNSHDHVGQTNARSRRVSNILGLGGVLGQPGRAIGGLVGGWAANITLQTYSRRQENEADQRAIEYTDGAGIDPDGLARWFERLRIRFGDQRVALFASHPSHKNRVRDIRDSIKSQNRTRKGRRNSDRFVAARDRARVIHPYYVDLHRTLAGSDAQATVEACDRGIAALPQHAAFYFWKGMLAGTSDDTAIRTEGLLLLRRAAELDPRNYLTQYLAGLVELSAGLFEDARDHATATIELVPFFPTAFYVRGRAELGLKNKEAAHRDFERALDLVPNRQKRAWLKEIEKVAPDFRKG